MTSSSNNIEGAYLIMMLLTTWTCDLQLSHPANLCALEYDDYFTSTVCRQDALQWSQ